MATTQKPSLTDSNGQGLAPPGQPCDSCCSTTSSRSTRSNDDDDEDDDAALLVLDELEETGEELEDYVQPINEATAALLVRDARDVRTRVATTRRMTPATEVQELVAVRRDGDILVRPGAGASLRTGHSYSRVVITAQARVHLGDSIESVVNNFYGAGAAPKEELGEDDTALVQAVLEFIIAVIHTAHKFCILLERTMTAVSLLLPSSHLVYFEDALFRRAYIDVQFIGDWTSFHFILERMFHDDPYAQNVTNFKYRLFDRSRSQATIDPQRPPPYANVFKAGRHVQMSIHLAPTRGTFPPGFPPGSPCGRFPSRVSWQAALPTQSRIQKPGSDAHNKGASSRAVATGLLVPWQL